MTLEPTESASNRIWLDLVLISNLFFIADKIFPGDTGGSLYDGRQQILYWADVSTEIAFIVPSPPSQSLSSCTGI